MKLYENLTLDSLEKEIWVSAIGFDGRYEVSNLGRVKSLSRLVPNGKSERVVNEKILRQCRSKRDGRLCVVLSANNVRKTHSVSSLIYYSFNPNKIDDNLNDEVYHINKISHDNRLSNLGYNKIKGSSYAISIKLGNVKHLEEARKALHKYTKETATIVDGVITHRKCKKCKTKKSVSLFENSRNTCKACRIEEVKERYILKKLNSTTI